jgi:hypothetical protein
VTERRGRRRRKLLDDLKERRGYWHLKEEALDRTLWRARVGRGFGPVVRQTAKWINEWTYPLRKSVEKDGYPKEQSSKYRVAVFEQSFRNVLIYSEATFLCHLT